MALKRGEVAPNFRLRLCPEGEMGTDSLGGYKLIVFYKVSCPTCQLTLPFIERLYRSYGDSVHFMGVSQDSCSDTESFAKNYGLTFPQLSDEPDYRVSIDYDVQVVPTVYLVNPEGKVVFVEESFVKSSLESLNEELARLSGREVNPLFEDVSVPPFKAG
ncbi:peroxiredoxin family protein [Hydrogenivirga sp.]